MEKIIIVLPTHDGSETYCQLSSTSEIGFFSEVNLYVPHLYSNLSSEINREGKS